MSIVNDPGVVDECDVAVELKGTRQDVIQRLRRGDRRVSGQAGTGTHDPDDWMSVRVREGGRRREGRGGEDEGDGRVLRQRGRVTRRVGHVDDQGVAVDRRTQQGGSE